MEENKIEINKNFYENFEITINDNKIKIDNID